MSARDVVLDRFAWVDGHADVWAVFRDADALRVVVTALVEPFLGDGVTAVCGIESRGFLLGGAAAVQLGVGFVPICSVIVDDMTDRLRAEIGRAHALVRSCELPDDGQGSGR